LEAILVFFFMQAFAEVLSNNESWTAPMEETYGLLGVDPASVQGLEEYLKVGGWVCDKTGGRGLAGAAGHERDPVFEGGHHPGGLFGL
jgi:hypothetical protein